MKNYYLALLFLSLKIHSSCFGDCVYGLKLKFDIGLQKELFKTLENGNIERAESIIGRNRNHAHLPNSLGQNPLYSAVSSQNLPMVKFLLTKKAMPNVLTNDGDTALHLATKNRMTEVLVYLLSSYSSFMCTKDRLGFIPFDYAKLRRYHFLTNMLEINYWQKINPELFIDNNKEFINAQDNDLEKNYFFTNNDHGLEDLVEQYIIEKFPENLGDYSYVISKLKKFLKDKRDNHVLCVSSQDVKNLVQSFFCSKTDHLCFPENFAYCDLISSLGNYNRPFPVIRSISDKLEIHPITRTHITAKLGLIASFKYWQAKKLPIADFNRTLKEGDAISFDQFEVPIEQAKRLAELQNSALPEDFAAHASNGFLPSSTFVDLLNVKKIES